MCRLEYQKDLETQLEINVTQEETEVVERWKLIKTSVINTAKKF